MTALNKQALIAKIKKQTKSFDTVVLKEDEANLLLGELESQQTFQQAFFRQSLMYDVVAEAYEEAKEQIANDVGIKARLCLESNSLFDRLRAAEKRIAELEGGLEVSQHDLSDTEDAMHIWAERACRRSLASWILMSLQPTRRAVILSDILRVKIAAVGSTAANKTTATTPCIVGFLHSQWNYLPGQGGVATRTTTGETMVLASASKQSALPALA
ncbi:TPA: hypothetical protein MYP48_003013 [Citrobacter freundii]|uniref:hypothetical protein n=1 Tax=Citrobacter freundii TaxID=546 RepID=UPI001BD15EBD|nr:hypothetical protein [Citrobacter freundii]HCB1601141.1 hypothetical protein [Citrobacter freundii]HCB1725711.1 hypothetical protein [Citrobacter freundii]HCB1877263.1 hypothetical protein [Citrobacter freundii]